MEVNKQSQKAGDGAQQIQVGTMIVNQGATEERVRAIFKDMIPQAIATYTNDAYEIAIQRINKLEQTVIPQIAAIDGALKAFADPAFQKVLKKAQQSAAATEREDDYALLSELLICHIEKGEQRKNRVAISKAIEIIDVIDNDALCALTIGHVIGKYFPKKGNIEDGCKIFADLFSHLLYMELPTNTDWIEHLEILGAIKQNSLASMKKFSDINLELMNGYACIGIKIGSEEYQTALKVLKAAHVNPTILIPNTLLDGFVRLPIVNKNNISDIIVTCGNIQRELKNEEKEAIEKVLQMYVKDKELQQLVNTKFLDLLDSYESIKKVHKWWDTIPKAFEMTKIGTILAYTNAKRCEENLPDLV